MRRKTGGKAMGRKARAQPRRRRAARIAKKAAANYPERQEEVSYERAVVKSIIDGKSEMESEDAVTLAAALSSLTGSLKRISYNYGISIGRVAYRQFEARRHSRWHGDSIQDAVLFMERLGYGYILYRILTDNVEVQVYRKNRAQLGCNIHSFDAGVIAGFLGAARGEFIRVTEQKCCNNGADFCSFTTAHVAEDRACANIRGIEALFRAPRSEGRVREEYQVLVSGPLVGAEHASRVNGIFAHLGREAIKGFPDRKVSARSMRAAADIAGRFGLGTLEYSAKPRRIRISLRGAKAKKEFVDISISFLNGMMGDRFGRPLRPHLLPGRKGAYKILMEQ